MISSVPFHSETRQWGSFTVLDQGQGYQVKRLEVKPGARLSLQYHEQRQEHWLLVQGCAEVTLGDRPIRLHVGDSLDIPVRAPHRISNPGSILLIMIEVQLGSYLGEDDIVRLQDDYGRC